MITTELTLALQQLRAGEVVAIPTETVYGLAACVSKPAAVLKVFSLKQRPLSHPLIVHVAKDMPLLHWVDEISPVARALMARFWPGPLTLIFPTSPQKVSPVITGGQPTVAIRCPAHPVAQALLAELGETVVAPSANPFGSLSPTTAMHVQQGFAKEDLLILDGGRCEIGMESTIVAVVGEQCQVLRAGAISEAALRDVSPVVAASSSSSVRVSGQLKQHYQPRTPLYVYETAAELSDAYQRAPPPAFVVAFEALTNVPSTHLYRLSTDPVQAMYELYYQLHRLDHQGAKALLVQLPPLGDAWDSVRDRLMRGSAR